MQAIHIGPTSFWCWTDVGLMSAQHLLPPSEEFELTANSLAAHIETHSGLILRTLSYFTVTSQDDSHCELSGSLQLTPWAHCYHCMVSLSGDLMNSSQQAHCVSCELTESSQQAHSLSHLVSSLWVNWVASKWAFCEFQRELPVS